MDSQSKSTGDASHNRNQAQKGSRLLLSAIEIMMNKQEEEEEALEIVNSLESSKCKHCAHCSDGIAAITKTIRSTMIEINEIKERNRERRHRELLQLFQNYLNQSHNVKSSINTKKANINSTDEQSNESNVNKVVFPPLSVKTETSEMTKSQQLLAATKKRPICASEEMINEMPTKRSIETMSSLNIETLSHSVEAEIVKAASQKYELVAMREKMLALQRRKMEDRERKKLEISQIHCK